MALELHGLNKEKLLLKVKQEFDQSRRVVNTKRTIFRERLKLYKEDTKPKNKVSVNLCYSNIRALMALSLSDELMVTFDGRDFSDETQAGIWTKMAKFDRKEM